MATGSRHPLRDLDAAMGAVLERVRADAAGTGPDVRLRIDPEFARPGTTDGYPAVQQVVGVIEGHEFAAGFEYGLEASCATVMGVLQDEIVAVLGRPWPEVGDTGSGLGVLDVALEPSGIAHWTLRGEPVCPVGLLTASCRALGWRVR